MKTRKIRLLALVATLALLATGVFSSVSVSAESWVSTGTPMQTATVTFVDLLPNGQRGGNTTQSISMYNDYHNDSRGKYDSKYPFNSTSTTAYWMMADRFSGFSNNEIWKGFSTNPGLTLGYLVIDWDREDCRFEIVESYTLGDRRALVIPHYGFVLTGWRTVGGTDTEEKAFYNAIATGLDNGEEYVVEVNLDDMVDVFTTRANNSGYVYTCYEELLFGVNSAKLAEIKAGTASLPEETNITIASVDQYETITCYNNTQIKSTPLNFHPTVYNGTLYSDQIGLYDSTMDITKIPSSSLAHYIPLVPVEGKTDVYKVGTYTAPNHLTGGASRPASIPEGQYLLVLTHFMPTKMLYRQAYDVSLSGIQQRVSNFLYKSIAVYFAADKEFKIEFNNTVTPDFETQDVGGVRVKEPAGLRFKTEVNNYKALTAAGYTVEAGTMIVPTDYLGDDRTAWDTAYTKEALDETGNAYLDIKRTTWEVDPATSADGKGVMYAAMVNIKEKNYERDFAARAYVTIKLGTFEKTFYSDTIAVRSVHDVATAALADTTIQYTDAQIAVLKTFAKQS